MHNVRMYACTHMHPRAHVHTRTHTLTHTHSHTRTLVRAHTHTHTHTHHRGSYEGPDLYASASALAAARPYVVPLTDLHIHFMHVGAVRLEHLGYALNGVMVGLAVLGGQGGGVDPGSGPVITGSLSGQAPLLRSQGRGERDGGAAPLQRPEMAVCVGVGLVRAADMQKQELYVLTPTPVEQLEQVSLEELEQVGLEELEQVGLEELEQMGLGQKLCMQRCDFSPPRHSQRMSMSRCGTSGTSAVKLSYLTKILTKPKDRVLPEEMLEGSAVVLLGAYVLILQAPTLHLSERVTVAYFSMPSSPAAAFMVCSLCVK